MLIDKRSEFHRKHEEKILEMQLGGWLVESHCWEPIDETGMKQCRWCSMVWKESVVISTFPLCPRNPIILKLEEEFNVKRTNQT